jgi:sigma-E factor negative regulatory protein RseA
MADRSQDDAISFESLSALVDNEATDREVQRAVQAWRDQPEARERWNTYQLIGDTLRAEGLARGGRSDADFLASLRGRLDAEPVVLAPQAAAAVQLAQGPQVPEAPATAPQVVSLDAARQLRRRRWSGPLSVAAGFVMVLSAVVSMVNGNNVPGASADTVAQAGSPAAGAGLSLAQGFQGEVTPGSLVTHKVGLSDAAPSFTENAQGRRNYLVLMRDDQLDQLMAAQRQLGASRSLSGAQVQPVSFGASAP